MLELKANKKRRMHTGMLVKIIGALAATSAIGVGAANAQASFENATLFVEVTINDFCSVSDGGLNFSSDGSSLLVDGTLDAQTTVSVNCSSDLTSWTLSFFGVSGDDNHRFVVLPGAYPNPNDQNNPFDASIAYQLYSDSSRTLVLGNSDATETSAVTGQGNATVDIFGTLTAPDFQLPAGRYTGTEGMTVTF